MTTHINLRMLSYLVALADHRHFGKAAEACFVSQPTLSAQLKKLEEQLDVVLVERQPRNILLTPAGEAIVARARKMLLDADEIEAIARASRDPLAGTLRLGLIPTLGPYLLPHFVGAVRQSIPTLQCQYFEYQTDSLLAKLHAGDIDAGILALPVDTEGLCVRELFAEPFCLAVPGGSPFAKFKEIRMQDLSDRKFMLLEDGHCLRDQALEVCALAGVGEETSFRATSLETLRQMVAAGTGMTLLPALAVERGRRNENALAIVRFADPVPERRIAAIWRASSAQQIASNAICDQIVRHLPDSVRAFSGVA